MLVLVAVGLRGYRLASPAPLLVDEAESAINALTIVADGVPGDRYLGLPLYENTLVRPWPGNAEYEFRDLSYSDRGLAVYHSWLPLYSMAAAFRLAGVTPEAARRGTPLRDATQAEIDYWTAVPRVPSVLFGAVFVIAAWGLGRRMHGPAAAVAMAFAGATSSFFVGSGRVARYYSATLAGSTVCALAIWNAWRRGRLLDHALAGLAIGVLFHIHSLSAVAMSALYLLASPLGRHQPRLWLRVLTAGGTAAVLILPWAAWSGLLGHAYSAPAGRDHIDLPLVLWELPRADPFLWATFVVGLAWLAIAARPQSRLSDRWRTPILDEAAGIYFATVWMVLGYAVFCGLIPAASFFVYRLKLMVAVPGLLLMALFASAFARAVRPSWALLPAAGLAGILVLSGQLPPAPAQRSQAEFGELLGLVRGWTLGPGGRIFGSPSDHLVWTYYSGRPVQSIAPVRREWLGAFASDLVIIESGTYHIPAPAEVQAVARPHGVVLTVAEAAARARDATRLATALDLQADGASVVPPPRVPDPLDRALVDLVHRSTRVAVQGFLGGTPIGRDETISNWQDFRTSFYYWFSNPAGRSGAALNYRSCRAEARAHILASGFTVLDCRKDRPQPLVPASMPPRAE